MNELTSIEVCAGAGGQALGLEQAGFRHVALVEIDRHCCATLRTNRPSWNVIQQDLRDFDGHPYKGVDLLAGGVPCPPISVAGKQLGESDERNLFPEALRLIAEIRPKAVMIENVRGLFDAAFDGYRAGISSKVGRLGYRTDWTMLNACDYGVPQLRPRVVFVAVSGEAWEGFGWPLGTMGMAPTVGQTLFDLIKARGWKCAASWRDGANQIAPTIVGGSLKHGGPDLGPTRARRAWANLGVDGVGIADEAPGPEFQGNPKLTARMVARIQGFPDTWQFTGGKTAVCRQVGNAFPPPVARAVGERIFACLTQPEFAFA
jgi:DNA (cytosine-5)-methyltransferase 1